MFINLCQINVFEVLFLCLIKLLLIILVKKFFNLFQLCLVDLGILCFSNR